MRHVKLSYSLLLLALLVLPACTSFDVVNGITGSGHYVRYPDLVYRDGTRGRLDVYTPEAIDAPAPVIVFFYGGGWREGARSDYEFVASRLTAAGYVVAIPDYRLHPEVTFPVFVEDGAAAVAWLLDNVAVFRGDPSRVALAGHSAGAHIAALLALDRRYLEAAGARRQRVDAFIGLSGPYDFLPLGDGYLQQVFPESMRAASQPINAASGAAPPSLLVHGTDDETVLPANSERLADALSSRGVPVTLRFYDGVGHARVVAALASPLDRLAPTANDVIAFLQGVPAFGDSRSALRQTTPAVCAEPAAPLRAPVPVAPR